MAGREHKTWADYMVIAISPALIMLMIWSLVAFLLTVVYRGPYPTRLGFIFAMFVMGAVLVTRISIEDGTEYASLFAIPLAIVMGLAAFRFAWLGGVSLLLIGFIWWCANKLTWDCTVIDEAEDASGEGLLQVMGLEQDHVEKDAAGADADGNDAQLADPSTPRDMSPTPRITEDPVLWWRARVARRRQRRHTPGLWVVYFSLLALPIFGLLQRYIPSTDEAARRTAFFLLCSYVACTLGLLMTTSFLGLRRYLRQRRLQMPMEMAGMWLVIGALLIGVVLIACVVLPRPGAALAISQLPFSIQWPDYRQPNRFAVGPEGVESNRQTARAGDAKSVDPKSGGQGSGGEESGTRPDSSNSATSKSGSGGSAASPKSGKTAGQPAGGGSTSKSGGSQQANSDSQRPTETGAGDRSGQRPQNAETGSQPGKSPAANSAKSASSTGSERPANAGSPSPAGRNSPPADRNSRAASSPNQKDGSAGQPAGQPNSPPQQNSPGQSGEQKPSRDQSTGRSNKQHPTATRQPGDQSQSQEPVPAAGRRPEQQSANSNQQQQTSGASQGSGSRSPQTKGTQQSKRAMFSDRSAKKVNDRSSSAAKSRPASTSPQTKTPSAPSRGISQILSGVTNVFGKLVKVLFILALLAFVVFLAWKYRDTIQQALQQLLDDLRKIWERLFGRRAEPEMIEAAATELPGQQRRTFASFSDPFIGGAAARWTNEQVVHYTFAALEAWAEEHGCGRAVDQTPLEFAQHLAGQFPDIGSESTHLADLYSRIAYGKRRISSRHNETLQRLWQLLVQTATDRGIAEPIRK